jgi:hypothetical protein
MEFKALHGSEHPALTSNSLTVLWLCGEASDGISILRKIMERSAELMIRRAVGIVESSGQRQRRPARYRWIAGHEAH